MGKWWSNGKRTKAGIKHEYEKFQSSAKAKAERASRNSARRSAIRKGLAHKGDNTSVDHIDSNPRHNSPSNLRVISRSANAGRKEDSRLKGSKRSARRKKR